MNHHQYYLPVCKFIPTSKNQIEIEFDPDLFNRKNPKDDHDDDLKEFIETIWNSKLEFAKQNNKMLFNAAKLRLHNAMYDETTKMLKLQIGLTDYKNFIGIHAAVAAGKMKNYIINKNNNSFSSEATQYFSNILGVETAVISSDDKAVLFRRSQKVAEYPNSFVFPGGHPEVSKILLAKNKYKNNNIIETQQLTKDDVDLVRQEFFDSAIDEIIAEAGLKREQVILESLTLLGISIPNLDRGSKPVACFKVRTTCTLEEMLKARFGAEEIAEFGDHSQKENILIIESAEHAHKLFQDEMKRFLLFVEREQQKTNPTLLFEYRFTPATMAILEHF